MLSRPVVYLKFHHGTLEAEMVGEAVSTRVDSTALAHSRSLMGDFLGVEAAVREAFVKLGLLHWYSRAPIAVVHLVPKVEGGYTNVEARAFREAVYGAGAKEIHVITDQPLLPSHDRAAFVAYYTKLSL